MSPLEGTPCAEVALRSGAIRPLSPSTSQNSLHPIVSYMLLRTFALAGLSPESSATLKWKLMDSLESCLDGVLLGQTWEGSFS